MMWIEMILIGKGGDMMKKFLFISIASLISFASCQKPEATVIPSEKVEKTFTAQCESKVKTVLNNASVMWQSGDQIRVFWNNGSVVADAKIYNYNSYAEFTARVEEADAYYAIYPASAGASFESGKISVPVLSTQGGMFADASLLCAKADVDNKLRFRHLVGYLEFTTDEVGVVTVSGSPSGSVAGEVVVNGFDAETGVPSLSTVKGAASISVDVKASGTYYIAVLPDATLDYLSITLADGTTRKYALSTNGLQFHRGRLVGLGNITDRLSDKPLYPVVLEDFEVFEDFDFAW